MSTLAESIAHIENLVETTKGAVREELFLRRILIQAVLTNGGKLDIDTSKAEEAMSGDHRLEFGNGKVTIHGSEHSLWPEPKNNR